MTEEKKNKNKGNSKEVKDKNNWIKRIWKFLKSFIKKLCKSLSNVFKWLIFANEIDEDSPKYRKSMNSLRIVGFICFFSLCAICITNLKKIHDGGINGIINVIKSFNLGVYFLISIVIYLIIRVYWDWIKKVWKFLQEDKIVHYIFLVIIPIGIIFFGYKLFSPLRSITINNEKQDIKAIIMTSSDLHGFYASLFTAIAVIVAVFALIGWRRYSELTEKLNKFKEVEEKVDFLNEKEALAEWVKETVEKLGLNTFELDELDKRGRDNVKKIKDCVIKHLTNDAWLELFIAHQFMTEEKKYDKAENVLEFIEDRDLLEEKSKIQPFLYHFLGQLYWKKYENEYKSKFNLFNVNVSKLKGAGTNEKKKALKLLEKSSKHYKKSIKYAEKLEGGNNHDDQSLGNLGVVLIEIHKINPDKIAVKKESSLDMAINVLKDKIKEKNYNTYYDLARAYYYKGEEYYKKAKECLNNFKENLELFDRKKRYERKVWHKKAMGSEKKELDGDGFPGNIVNIEKFFD